MYKLIFFSLVGIFICNSINAQLSHSLRGISFGYYDQSMVGRSLDKDYRYRSYTMSVIQRKKIIATPLVAITYDIQTQLGMIEVTEEGDPLGTRRGIETALIPGINIEASLLPDWWWVYVGASVGPQFISIAPRRQNKGFIFSDSAYIGSRIYFGPRKQLDVKAGIRHQSNAGLSEPNGGIDSYFIQGGIMMNF